MFRVRRVLQYSSKEENCGFLRVCICALTDLWGHAGSPANVCVCVRARAGLCVGRAHPPRSAGVLTERLCASHVKFMLRAAFTKEPWNGFRGNIMPERRGGRRRGRRDGRKKIEQRKEGHGEREGERYKRGKVNVPWRREKEKEIIPLDSQRVE